ncbi:MAG: Eco57I restriction-modification methylase domain-containing protein [Clostridia bacterium]|nr:Eco57I restriction-modification methylase domain-containing protein [Clostridia bacterium]
MPRNDLLSAIITSLKTSFDIIVTHRPVVGSGWREDFGKIFRAGEDAKNYAFVVKDTAPNNVDYDESIDQKNELNLRGLDQGGKYFIYFASIQDLRGSKRVGGTFHKNNAVFDMDWDLIIIDEAHEGTQTLLGDNVVKALRKEKTKVLALSGTPFNILDQYDENAVYTWDYVMEQKRKAEWDILHPGDHNPYADLPRMHIYTYELGDKIPGYVEHELEGKAFNFREFFRTWTGDPEVDKSPIPAGQQAGDFRHAEDVLSFLNLITKPDADSLYPYSTKEYRNMFKHTLWMVPGVKEAKALSKMLREHPVFCHFGIANVAGEGDEFEESHYDDALELVRKTIKENDYSITLSCGKLTTGVTVKEWTAVFMLAGSYSTAAAGYMQTIFRVQSAGQIDGKQKTDCYVFDFAPDRTLKVLAETANVSRKAGKAGKRQGENREIMSDFLNFCPVIAIQGTEMKPYSVNTMMEQLKRVYAEKAIRNGFDDASIYNDNLMRLDDIELESFKKLKGIVGASKAAPPLNDVEVNAQGFSEEEHQKAEAAQKKPKRERTPEELALLEKLQEQRKNRNNAISILRGVSIRMPLLIYGANVALDEDISIERFVSMVDDTSWEEFMPNGVTKDIFADFLKYYDRDVFVSAGKEIRKLAASADVLTPTQRVMAVVKIFDYFKNPDKETVLTPWRVVNMHMSDCLGGWCFYDEKFEKKLDTPRFVDRGQVTADTLANPNAQILEINSKSGLYPLYVAYSIYRAKLGTRDENEMPLEQLYGIWEETVRENVFVICKTPMAKSITMRTLLGYTKGKINAHYFEDLINHLKNKPEQFRTKVTRGKYWGKEVQEMKFDAIVGNPPYQSETVQHQSNVNGQAPRKSIFQYFQMAADEISSGVVSLIYPGARWIHRSGKGMQEFGLQQINDVMLERVDFYPNANEIFADVAIADGITMVLKNKRKTTSGFMYVFHKDGIATSVQLDNPGEDLIPLNPQNAVVLDKIALFVEKHKLSYMHSRILPRNLFGIESDFVENNPSKVREYREGETINPIHEIKLLTNDKAGKAGRAKWFVADRDVIPSNQNLIAEWQVVVSSANAGGQKRDNQIEIVDDQSAFGRSRVALGTFKTLEEAQNFFNYAQTYLIKFLFLMTDESLTSLGKKVPDILDYTCNNKMIDFTRDLDSQLYTLFGLSDDEIAHVIKTVQKQRNNG